MKYPKPTPEARLTDAEALAQFKPLTRAIIAAGGWVRCLVKPNAWHAAIPPTRPDYGNGRTPHYEPCRCRVGVK
jgi:hypothetical protein